MDRDGIPTAVLTGSTNWTSTGLCAQTNNAAVVQSPDLAAAYLDYWHRLKSDDADQTASFRLKNRHTSALAKLDQGTTSVKVWFAPNTQQKTKPPSNPPTPLDLEEVFAIVRGAQKAVLFLAFMPGSPSVMDVVREVQLQHPNLFVRGAVTDQEAAAEYIDLYHREGGEADARVILALGIPDSRSLFRSVRRHHRQPQSRLQGLIRQ